MSDLSGPGGCPAGAVPEQGDTTDFAMLPAASSPAYRSRSFALPVGPRFGT
jgi:hypothetical protein